MTDPNPIPNEVEHLMNMRKLLTTLGPDNSSSVAENLNHLNCFDTAERVKATVALIVDKALEEPQFAESCARLCSRFASVEVADAPGEPLRFRKVLVGLVQQCWEKADTEYCGLEANLRLEEGSELLRKNLENAHNRYLTITRFLAQLHVNGLLLDRTVVSLLRQLLPTGNDFEDVENVSEGRIECVRLLLETCAPHMKEQTDLDVFIERLETIITAKAPSQIRLFQQMATDVTSRRRLLQRAGATVPAPKAKAKRNCEGR